MVEIGIWKRNRGYRKTNRKSKWKLIELKARPWTCCSSLSFHYKLKSGPWKVHLFPNHHIDSMIFNIKVRIFRDNCLYKTWSTPSYFKKKRNSQSHNRLCYNMNLNKQRLFSRFHLNTLFSDITQLRIIDGDTKMNGKQKIYWIESPISFHT